MTSSTSITILFRSSFRIFYFQSQTAHALEIFCRQIGWIESDIDITMFQAECRKYDPCIFPPAPVSIAFDLSGQDPLKLDAILDMSSLDAQKCAVLKAKNNFLEWYQNKIIMEENQ
jgi:hypothetical protein